MKKKKSRTEKRTRNLLYLKKRERRIVFLLKKGFITCLFLGKVREKEREDSWKEKIQIWIWNLRPCGSWIYPKGGGGIVLQKEKGIPEEGKVTFHEGFWGWNPEREEEAVDGTSEGMRFNCRECWFWGTLRLKLKPKSSFPAIIFFLCQQKNQKPAIYITYFCIQEGRKESLRFRSLCFGSQRERESCCIHVKEEDGVWKRVRVGDYIEKREEERNGGVVVCLSSIMTSCQ